MRPLLFLLPLVGLLSACQTTSKVENMLIPRIMIETRGAEYGALRGQTLRLPISGTEIIVDRELVVAELDILNVELVKVDMGLALLIETNDKGARALYRTSVTNRGSRLVFTTNDKAIGARRIDSVMNDGKIFTFVEVPDTEIGQLVLDLKASIAELKRKR